MRALSTFMAVMAIETAVEASATARAKSYGRFEELPLSPIPPGAFARWAAQREPAPINVSPSRLSTARRGIEPRRA